jgi:hypothetical protein
MAKLKIRIFSCAAVLLLFAAGSAFAMGGAASLEQDDGVLTPEDLPVSKVVLFSTGLGYFQRTGVVEADMAADLAFRTKDINDLLKSMVLQDFDGGSITSVNYSSREPLAVTLRSLAVDLSGNPGVVAILSQLRGEDLVIDLAAGGGTVRGSVVGIENKVGADGETRQMLNLYGKWGLHSVDMEEVASIRFADPVITAEFRRALELLSESRNSDEKRVTFIFTGTGERRVLVGYLLETPVWKTSYRLVLGDDDEHVLQGWAIVENTTTEDWHDVNLSLVSGRPVSFQMDLYSPIYITRPTLRVETQDALALQQYEEPTRSSGRMASPQAERSAMPSSAFKGGFTGMGEGASGSDDFGLGFDISQGVDSAATTQRAGEFFHYIIDKPIDLAKGESAMVPIVDDAIAGERISIYNLSSGLAHPYNGIRFTNSTGIDLSAGPLTVFESDTYAGDSTIGSLPDGGERLISFSLDLSTKVITNTYHPPEKFAGLSVLEGILITETLRRRETGYLLTGRGLRERKVLVEHAFLAGWDIVEPEPPEESTASLYRFEVDLPVSDGPDGVEKRLLVAEERVFEQRTDLLSAGNSFIQSYIDAETVDPWVKISLRGILERRDAIAEIVATRGEQESRRSAIYREQDRIRKNMANLAEETDLYSQYVTILSNQETELKELTDSIDELVKKERDERTDLERYVRSIQFDQT